VKRGTELIGRSSSYAPYAHNGVICVDDRLNGAAGLAGGALSLAFMQNYLFGGRLFSHALHYLQALGIYLSIHDNCGALVLAGDGLVQRVLTDVRAHGYRFLEALGLTVPMSIRRNIAAWAHNLPADFVDLGESKKVVKEVRSVSGPHLAGFVGVSLVDGYGFTAHDELKCETGMLAFRFDPTAAFREVRRVVTEGARAREAAYLALVFTTEVLLELTGPDLVVGVYG